MPKHIIVASSSGLMPPRYFLGYRDNGTFCEARWTHDPWQARWIDAAEAAAEVELLGTICPGYRLRSWSLDFIGTSDTD
jgi:hypothetical protein